MKVKSQKGSVTVFVLIALLFYTGFLVILYAGNINKIQTVSERTDQIKSIYERNLNNINEIYQKNTAAEEAFSWKETEEGITNGEITVHIGDKISYNELSNGVKAYEVADTESGFQSNEKRQIINTEDIEWRILGVNNKGELELISTNPTTGTLGLGGEEGYLNGEKILDTTCNELYGKGEYAISARNLKAEDINKLANYNPETYVFSDGRKYGEKWQYQFPEGGEYMQYRYNRTGEWTDWSNITEHQTFKMPGETNEISKENPGISDEIEYKYYSYLLSEKIKQKTQDGISISNLISKGEKNENYKTQWLSSCVSYGNTQYACFYLSHLYNDNLTYYDFYLYCSYGYVSERDYSIRPVVTLSSDIQLVGSSSSGWNIVG